MTESLTIVKTVALLEGLEHIYIIGHINPDGDCIGAALAMAMILTKKGLNPKILMGQVEDTYEYLHLKDYVQAGLPETVDAVIAVDCGDQGRFGDYNEVVANAPLVINIDHHISNPLYGTYNHVVDVSSTCELIYTMLSEAERAELLDQSLATALYTGIIYDTGVFKHSNTRRSTHEVAGALLDYGINHTDLIDRMFYRKSIKHLFLEKIAIENIQLFENKQVVMSHLLLKDLHANKAYKKHTEGISKMITEIKQVRVSAFIYEIKPGFFKISLRAKDTVDVCSIAAIFGGGGHTKAAGFTINEDLDTIKMQLLEAIQKQLG